MSVLIHDLSDNDLKKEFHEWDLRVKAATSWGASLAAANEFRNDCKRELKRRGISMETE